MTSTLDTTTMGSPEAQLSLEVTDVTGSKSLPVDVQASLAADAVAQSIADLMALPNNVPWALRVDRSSAYLRDGVAIGEQIATGERVTITPKTHLG